jgi:hypothetical protein
MFLLLVDILLLLNKVMFHPDDYDHHHRLISAIYKREFSERDNDREKK